MRFILNKEDKNEKAYFFNSYPARHTTLYLSRPNTGLPAGTELGIRIMEVLPEPNPGDRKE